MIGFEMSSCIGVDWSDEQYLLFLGGRKKGDPLPSNVITEMNPFSIEPWNASDNMFYLYSSKDTWPPNKKRGIKDTEAGYWKDMEHDLKIGVGPRTIGRKVTWEFYGGAAPFGNKIGWFMFEYKLELKGSQENDKAEGFSSLCRIFWQSNKISNGVEPHNSVEVDESNGDYIQSVLLGILEREEGNIGLPGPADGTQVDHGDGQGLLAVSDGSLQDNNSSDVRADCDFSIGDFIEMKDFDNLESSSSGSDNSSCTSWNSDEYFDSEALLRDLENENSSAMEEHHVDCKLSISGALRTNQVVFQPPPPGSVQNYGSDMLMGEEDVSSSEIGSGQRANPIISSSRVELSSNRSESVPVLGEDRKGDGVLILGSQSAETSRGSGMNRVGKIAKFGKRYFCFASF